MTFWYSQKTKRHWKNEPRLFCKKHYDNDLYLKPKKCFFGLERVEYLGMIIEEGKISMDPTKLKGIRNWPEPKTIKQVQSFLGFGNFY
jgi:hypothetical protein